MWCEYEDLFEKSLAGTKQGAAGNKRRIQKMGTKRKTKERLIN